MTYKTLIFNIFCLSLFACEHELPTTQDKVSAFTYSNNELELVKGDSAFSVVPNYQSTSDVQFELNISPLSAAISIDNKGVIKVDSSCSVGLYTISVKTTNKGGETLFSNAMQVRVQSKIISFASDIAPLVIKSCNPCHTEQNQSTLYTDYDNASALYVLITDRIRLPKSNVLAMPPSGNGTLSNADINLITKWNDDGLNP